MQVFRPWAEFKLLIADKNLLRFVDRVDFYSLEYQDIESSIIKDSGADQAEFESDFKNAANSICIQDVRPLTPKNEHTLLSEGMMKMYVNKNGKALNVTLSDKSGSSYTISGCSPIVGAYLCQDGFSVRAEVEVVNGSTVTLMTDKLSNGPAIYCIPTISEYVLTPVEGNTYLVDIGFGTPIPCLNLWGLLFDAEGFGKNDFSELSIVCVDGIEGILPPNTKVKDYDYSWVRNMAKLGQMVTPDGSPGIIPEGWAVRISYFCTEVVATDSWVDVFIDFIVTKKD